MPKSYTKEEKEWSSIDRILHPEVWGYYVNHDRVTGMDGAAGSSQLTQGGDKGNQAGFRRGRPAPPTTPLFSRDNNNDKAAGDSNNNKRGTALAMGKILGMSEDFAKQAGREREFRGHARRGQRASLEKKTQMTSCARSRRTKSSRSGALLNTSLRQMTSDTPSSFYRNTMGRMMPT